MTCPSRNSWIRAFGLLSVVALLVAVPRQTPACPFCSAVALTFSEEIGTSQVAVVAKLTQAPPKSDDPAANALDVAKAKFEIIQVLKGAEALGDKKNFEAVYFGDSPVGTIFLVMGIDPPNVNWTTPIAISERGVDYVTKAIDLPKADDSVENGANRLAFFQDFLEDSDEMLARDSYDEYAKAPYSHVLALKDRMKHDKLIEWVKSTTVPVSRRRLYLTMLGVCGTKDDLPLLEEMIQSKDRQTKGALDALVAAYLTLKGSDGMPLIEDLFLKNKDAEYTDTYAAIMALRFHGTEEKIIPRERLVEGLRTMLDRPQLADLVIPDLARWEDWSASDRLVELFKNSNEESSWVRVPVINFLRACPLPKAKEQLEELAKIDPESIKRANSFFPLAAAGGTPPADPAQAVNFAAPGAPAGEPGAPMPTPPIPVADKSEGEPQPAKETQPAKEIKPAAEAGAGVPSPAPPEIRDASPNKAPAEPATGKPTESGKSAEVAKTSPAVPGSVDLPGPPASSTPIYVGLSAAAVLLACAFWAILKGGQHVAG